MAGFEDFLNTAIPITLIIVGISFIWWKAKEPLNSLFQWIIGLFATSSNKIATTYQTSKEIVYDI